MDRTIVTKGVIEILDDILGIGGPRIEEETNLVSELSIDSSAIYAMIDNIETKFDIKFPDKHRIADTITEIQDGDIDDMTVGNIVDKVHSLIEQKNSQERLGKLESDKTRKWEQG